MKKEKSFEESVVRLKEIVELLEKGQVSLEDSLKLFEEGAGISSKCYEILRTAELKITEVQSKSDTVLRNKK